MNNAIHDVGAKKCSVAAVIAALTATPNAFASPVEITVDTAGQQGFVSLVYGAHTTNAALSSSADNDSYLFTGAAGDLVRVVASTSTAGVDAMIELRGPGGTLIASTSCNGHANFGSATLCAAVLDKQLVDNGTYTINISDAGANNVGSYALHLDQNPAANNWIGFPYGPTQPYAVGHLGDSDYFAFNAVAGSRFKLTVAGLTAGVDTHVSVWDTAGALIQNTECNGHANFGSPTTCSVVLDVAATTTGVYKFGVWDAGFDNTGNYEVSLVCTFPTCGTGMPSPVPEAPSAWLLSAGLAAFFMRRTRMLVQR